MSNAVKFLGFCSFFLHCASFYEYSWKKNRTKHFSSNFTNFYAFSRNDLKKRTFKTLDFYKEHQDFITPAGLSFFQSDWDTNLTEFYHHVLEIKEPVFEYDFPKPYHPPERRFPLKQPFNLYLDRYRDPKEVRTTCISMHYHYHYAKLIFFINPLLSD